MARARSTPDTHAQLNTDARADPADPAIGNPDAVTNREFRAHLSIEVHPAPSSDQPVRDDRGTAAMASIEKSRPRGSCTIGVERAGGETGKYSVYS